MAGYNERKLQVLEFSTQYDTITTRLVSDELDIEINLSRKLLAKYHKQGLFSRWSGAFSKIYQLTEKGWDRLVWLRETM